MDIISHPNMVKGDLPMIIRDIDLKNLSDQRKANEYCKQKYGCLFSDLSDSERQKVIKELKKILR